MNFSKSYIREISFGIMIYALIFSACKKSDNPNNLPDVNPSDYEGTIEGYRSADEIYPKNLKAYWSFDDTNNELKSGSAPTQASNNTFVPGMKGKSLKLSAGYLYYAKQLDAFKTDSLKSFTISSWIQITNNGSKKTMLMTLTRPGSLDGSFEYRLNTNELPATNTDVIKVGPRFRTIGGGYQDNLNASLSPKIGATVWTHLVLTYDGTTGIFKEWGNGIEIGSYNNRGTGNNLFKAYEPSEFIIGATYSQIPGKEIGTNVTYAAMTGNIDELRIFNTVISDAHIKALYNLGLAGK
ncbi:LamG-like jellyroll fold domain-containing protein [Pedobacter frigoris]|uniref:LamG domain-containing protein n=1 Tax=Pedobacter frigoris TaxID=2571272 RepID=A0A4V5P130_9SPHI|nr:LamG-like jellyroll fold domain-containing protein [Pedobacter frigoris]TKC04430.1 LamG domain-containing protein [Pedobacter frigoris]